LHADAPAIAGILRTLAYLTICVGRRPECPSADCMSANPDDELVSATAAMQELGSLDRRLNAAKRRSEESAEKAAAARDRVAVEARDVERLESMSFTKILWHLKGSHDDDVARETAEHEAG
jgi:hypothetical protein